ncbi:hypothetical protein PYCCODRAFT_1480649 [Trametes coccinea BRFM310]|uniref:Uncharacterized protein n=1 Tax=Trametes coccinea (strain BRFM310) TaxID=1353009 RepID=A0A1Y2IBG8_TRAC3|nr:hypothetical protein PYCCODRAFT_1480649 [Trametes coccinea BRFM310]
MKEKRNRLPRAASDLRNALYKDCDGRHFPSLEEKMRVFQAIMRIPGIIYSKKLHLNWCSYKQKELRKAANLARKSDVHEQDGTVTAAQPTSAGSSSIPIPLSSTGESAEIISEWLRERLGAEPDPPLSVLCRWADALGVSVGDVAVILRKLAADAGGGGTSCSSACAGGGGGGDGDDVGDVGDVGTLSGTPDCDLDDGATDVMVERGTWQVAPVAADAGSDFTKLDTTEPDADAEGTTTVADGASPYEHTYTAYSPTVFSPPMGLPYADEPSGLPAHWDPRAARWTHDGGAVEDHADAAAGFVDGAFYAGAGKGPQAGGYGGAMSGAFAEFG